MISLNYMSLLCHYEKSYKRKTSRAGRCDENAEARGRKLPGVIKGIRCDWTYDNQRYDVEKWNSGESGNQHNAFDIEIALTNYN
jgi:hypothetical protein